MDLPDLNIIKGHEDYFGKNVYLVPSDSYIKGKQGLSEYKDFKIKVYDNNLWGKILNFFGFTWKSQFEGKMVFVSKSDFNKLVDNLETLKNSNQISTGDIVQNMRSALDSAKKHKVQDFTDQVKIIQASPDPEKKELGSVIENLLQVHLRNTAGRDKPTAEDEDQVNRETRQPTTSFNAIGQPEIDRSPPTEKEKQEALKEKGLDNIEEL